LILAAQIVLSLSALADEPVRTYHTEDTESDDEVVVSGRSNDNGSLPETNSAQVTVIELGEQSTSDTVTEIVERSAGVNIRHFGGLGDWSSVSIRGSSWQQVQVYLDGIPLNPDGISSVNLAEMPTGALSRIEVWRGNAPPSFDAAPIGGVINLVTRDGSTGANGSFTYGSHDTVLGRQTVVSNQQLGSWEVDTLVAAESFSTEGDFTFFDNNSTDFNIFDDALTTRTNNDKTQANALLKISGANNWGRVTLLNNFLARIEGIPGPGVAQTLFTSHEAFQDLLAIQIERDQSSTPWTFRLWELLRYDEYDNRRGEIGPGENWEENQYSTTGALFNLQHAYSGNLIAGVAVGERFDYWEATDLNSGSETTPRWRAATTVTPNIQAFLGESLTLDASARAKLSDNRSVSVISTEDGEESTELPEFELRVLPRGGFVWRPIDSISEGLLTVKGTMGMYERAPDFTELFGDKGAMVGNPELLPESGYSIDLGLRTVFSGRLNGSVDLAGFHRRSTNLISYVQNSQNTMIPVNLGAALVRGLEASISLRLDESLSSDTAITRVWSSNLSKDEAYAGNQLPNLPNLELNQTTSINIGEALSVSHTWSYTGGNYWDKTNWYLSSPRSIHSLFARFNPLVEGVEFEISVRNLLNRMVDLAPTNPLDPSDDSVALQGLSDFHGYPLPGRTAMFSLSWSA